jgi:hypothetical protein
MTQASQLSSLRLSAELYIDVDVDDIVVGASGRHSTLRSGASHACVGIEGRFLLDGNEPRAIA